MLLLSHCSRKSENTSNLLFPDSSIDKDRSFLERLSSEASEELIARFSKNCIDYIDATAREAGLRASCKWPSFEEYVQLRRLNGGVLPSFEMVEAALGFTIPQEVHNNDTFKELVFAAVDVICLSNVCILHGNVFICSFAYHFVGYLLFRDGAHKRQ